MSFADFLQYKSHIYQQAVIQNTFVKTIPDNWFHTVIFHLPNLKHTYIGTEVIHDSETIRVLYSLNYRCSFEIVL